MKNLTHLLFVMLIQVPLHLHSQDPTNTPVSPEAAAFAKSVNYPVNHNTGIPDISIPFYEITAGGLSLPVTLQYHGGGFRINEQAARTGLGWSISSDLQIVRTIKGQDDFLPGTGYLNNPLVRTYYPNPLTCPSCAYPTSGVEMYWLNNRQKDAEPDLFNYKLLNKSGSFYFRKNDAGTGYTIVPVPYDNIKIEVINYTFVITDTDGTVYHFGDPAVDNQDDYAARGVEFTESSLISHLTAWRCMRIVDAHGTNEITFTYTAKTPATYRTYHDQVEYYNNENPCALAAGGYYTSNNYPMTTPSWTYEMLISQIPFYRISSPKYLISYGNSIHSYFHVPYLNSSNQVVDRYYQKTNEPNAGLPYTIKGLSVSEISFNGGKVQFNGTDQLNYIRVLDHHNQEVKSLHFYQSYTTPIYLSEAKAYNGANFQGTPYLDSLHLRQGTSTYERYTMYYNNKFSFGNHLKGSDAWGYPNADTKEIAYANNTMGNILTLPTMDIIQDRFYRDVTGGCGNFAVGIPITIGGNNWAEAPDQHAMKRGVLKRIVYPTGGFTEFDFEPNQYTEEFTGYNVDSHLPQLSGGLRIRAINHYDANGDFANQQYYRYGMFEEGSGILLSRPARTPEYGKFYYGAVEFAQEMVYLQGPPSPSSCSSPNCLSVLTVEKKTTYQPASTLDYTYAGGAPIYYQKVTQYERNQEQSGKTVYEYYPPEYFYDFLDVPYYRNARIPGTNIPYQKTPGLMGQLKSISTYSGRGYGSAGYIRMSKKEYEYQRYLAPQQIRVVYSFLKETYAIPVGNYTGTWADLYSISGFVGPNITHGQYGIGVARVLMSKETEVVYDGADSLRTIRDYAYAHLPYLQPSSVTTQDSKGQSSVRTIKYPYNFVPGNAVYVNMVEKNMLRPIVEETETKAGEVHRTRTNYGVHSVGFGVIAPSSVERSINGGPLRTEMTYNQYDAYGNLLQYTGLDGLPVSQLWGYHYQQLVAVLRGVTYSEIPSAYKSDSQINSPSNDAALQTLLEGLRTALPANNMITLYTYKPLTGLSRQSDENGLTTYYDYDGAGRLIAVKDHHSHVLSAYHYHLRGALSPWASAALFANVPEMRTYSYEVSSGIRQLYNRFVPGGKYLTGYGQAIADISAREEPNDSGPGLNPDYPPPTAVANMATVEMYYSVDVAGDPAPMVVDLIQDGSIVGTYRLYPTSIHPAISTAYIPAGEYQLSFRINAAVNYESSILHFSFMGGGYGNDFVKSGTTVVLQPGEFYECLVSTRHLF